MALEGDKAYECWEALFKFEDIKVFVVHACIGSTKFWLQWPMLEGGGSGLWLRFYVCHVAFLWWEIERERDKWCGSGKELNVNNLRDFIFFAGSIWGRVWGFFCVKQWPPSCMPAFGSVWEFGATIRSVPILRICQWCLTMLRNQPLLETFLALNNRALDFTTVFSGTLRYGCWFLDSVN